MARNTTRSAVAAILAADPSVSGELSAKIEQALSSENVAQTLEPLVRYDEAARMLGCTRKYVGILARQGKLTPVNLSGCRSNRVTASSLRAILNTRNAKEAHA